MQDYIKLYFHLLLFYGYGASCLALRGEQRLKVFENRVLTRIFGPKR
jgi:hypothetical protein